MDGNVRKVVLLKSGTRIAVEPSTPKIKDILKPLLRFTEKRFLYGKERVDAGKHIEFQDWNCFVEDHRGRLVTAVGFYKTITRALKINGYQVVVRNIAPKDHAKTLRPFWERLVGEEALVSLRYGQDDFMQKLARQVSLELPGRFDCPPGFGKSFAIGAIGMLFPYAKIHVVSKRVPVLRDRIYKELLKFLPSVGICGGGMKVLDRRVMCYTVDSLHHSDGDADILIGDECHELAADKAAERIGSIYGRTINIGLSATHDMRLDGKDIRTEAMFGPVVYSMGYEEAQEHKLVVPIRVIWSDVYMDSDPCEGLTSGVAQKRRGIWRNDVRNRIIANDARKYGEDVQMLAVVETIDHAMHLKKFLPEFTLVYADNGLDPRDKQYYVRKKLIPANEPDMTFERKAKLTRLFEKGKLKRVIATPVWNVGVSFDRLGVLFRCDAGGSPINDVQIPGRTSRNFDGKAFGVVHDYKDQFNKGFRRKASGRRSTYEEQGWEQIDESMPAAGQEHKHLWSDMDL